jgi:hypothetical protein
MHLSTASTHITTRYPHPSFDALVKAYPNPRTWSVHAVKELIGGGADDTSAPPPQQWLGGDHGDTCTLRMSRALNYSGYPIPAHFPGLRTVKGKDKLHYAFAVQEIHAWLKKKFGPPDIYVKGKPVKRDNFLEKKGIILFDINFGLNRDGVTRALGHVDLWDGKTFYDEIVGISWPDRDFFKIAGAVSLWLCKGKAVLSK